MTLDKLSTVIMLIGASIAILAMCCLDSEGTYMYYAGAVCILGGFVAGAGYGLRVLSERRKREEEMERMVRAKYFKQMEMEEFLDGREEACRN